MSKDTDQNNKWEKMAKEAEAETEQAQATPQSEDAAEGIESPSRQQLEDQLTAMEQQCAEAKDKMMLAYAELENVRKRSERDVQNAHRFANEKILVELLPIVDSLTRAMEGEQPTDPQAKAIREGVQLTRDLLDKTLEKFGVESINPEQGSAFNPELHEAMSMMPAPDAESNTIVQVLQPGYQLNNRVIRAAMVIVAA